MQTLQPGDKVTDVVYPEMDQLLQSLRSDSVSRVQWVMDEESDEGGIQLYRERTAGSPMWEDRDPTSRPRIYDMAWYVYEGDSCSYGCYELDVTTGEITYLGYGVYVPPDNAWYWKSD